ncbi:arylamine N-acetyltransferase [Dongia sp.]|uniref:arylamine N-acetyltransferase n=1 Tax=Dongia sp. TaxID=1977262 RepID=UPI0035B16C55
MGTIDPADFGLANWYVSTHPGSSFTQQMIVARPFAEGRQIPQERMATGGPLIAARMSAC